MSSEPGGLNTEDNSDQPIEELIGVLEDFSPCRRSKYELYREFQRLCGNKDLSISRSPRQGATNDEFWIHGHQDHVDIFLILRESPRREVKESIYTGFYEEAYQYLRDKQAFVVLCDKIYCHYVIVPMRILVYFFEELNFHTKRHTHGREQRTFEIIWKGDKYVEKRSGIPLIVDKLDTILQAELVRRYLDKNIPKRRKPDGKNLMIVKPSEVRECIPNKERFSFGNNSYRFFKDFISEANETIRILTNSLTYDAVKLIFSDVKPSVSVEIVTKRKRGYRDIIDYLSSRCRSVTIKKCGQLHAKLCIKDGNSVLVGSSNITLSSLGSPDALGQLEADIISSSPICVKKSLELYNRLVNNSRDESMIEDELEDFLSSDLDLIDRIERLTKVSCKVTLVIPPFIHKRMLGVMYMLNRNLRVVVHWPKTISKDYRKGLKSLRALARKDRLELKGVRENIHSKIYLFETLEDRKAALISSLNLTEAAWDENIECGIYATHPQVIEEIEKQVDQFQSADIDVTPEIREKHEVKEASDNEPIDAVTSYLQSRGLNKLGDWAKLYHEFWEKYESQEDDVDVCYKDSFKKAPSMTGQQLEVFRVQSSEDGTDETPDATEFPSVKENHDPMVYLYCAIILHLVHHKISADAIAGILQSIDVTPDPIYLELATKCLNRIDLDLYFKKRSR